MRRPNNELDDDTAPPKNRARKIIAIVVIVAVIAIGATAAMALTKSSPHTYRTATVTTGAVTKTLNSSGILQPIAQATVAFPIAGTVKTVNVHVGSQVSVGQTLASLDTTSLQQQLLSKQAALASAQLTLYKALNGQSVTGTGSHSASGTSSSQSTSNSQSTQSTASGNSTLTAASTTSSGSSSQPSLFVETAFTGGTGHHTNGSGNGGSGNGTQTNGATSVPAAQLLLIAAQRQADAAMNTAQVALQMAEQACGAPHTGPHNGNGHGGTGGTFGGGTGGTGGGTGGTGGGTGGGGPTTSTTAPNNNAPSAPSTGIGSQACIAAQQQLLTAQQALGDAQQQVTVAANTLTQLLNASASTPSSTPSTHSGSSGGSTHSTTPTVSTPSAEQLVAYQAAVDSAATQVLVAAQALQQATIASPLAGTVEAMSLTPGTQLSANSTTDNVVVVGTGGYEVATAVSVDEIESVKVGQSATVMADGTNTPLTAKVVSIGVAPTTSGNTTMYPVILGLTGTTSGLRNGGGATTAIDVAHADASALVVPTSAVHTLNNIHFVTVLQGHTTSTARVTLGVVGPDNTQITSGLKAGQVVVLADLKQAVPSSNIANRLGGTGSGLGGALTGATGFGGAGGGFGGGGGALTRRGG
jgi:trimeric autotransporter adhesin